MRQIISILILYLCSLQCLHAASVEVQIDSLQMIVGEQTTLHLSVNVGKGQKVRFHEWKPLEEITPGVEVVDAPKIDTTLSASDNITITQHITLTAFEDSLYSIPAQTVSVDGKELQSKPLVLKVYTMKVDTTNVNQFYGPKSIQDNPFLWGEWRTALWLAFALMVLYAMGILFYIRLKSKKPIRLKIRIVKRLPPHQKALDKIESIRKKESTQDEKSYYTALTEAIRKYIEERFGFQAMEMTSDQIIDKLQSAGDDKMLAELTELFQTADLVKFAKHSVGANANDRSLVAAVDYINSTKQDVKVVEEKIQPTASEEERQTIKVRSALKWLIAVIVIVALGLTAYTLYMIYDLVM